MLHETSSLLRQNSPPHPQGLGHLGRPRSPACWCSRCVSGPLPFLFCACTGGLTEHAHSAWEGGRSEVHSMLCVLGVAIGCSCSGLTRSTSQSAVRLDPPGAPASSIARSSFPPTTANHWSLPISLPPPQEWKGGRATSPPPLPWTSYLRKWATGSSLHKQQPYKAAADCSCCALRGMTRQRLDCRAASVDTSAQWQLAVGSYAQGRA